MRNSTDDEGLVRRGGRDGSRHLTRFWFWASELAIGASTPILVLEFWPAHGFRGISEGSAAVVVPVLAVTAFATIVFAFSILRAPIVQRNEARARLREIEKAHPSIEVSAFVGGDGVLWVQVSNTGAPAEFFGRIGIHRLALSGEFRWPPGSSLRIGWEEDREPSARILRGAESKLFVAQTGKDLDPFQARAMFLGANAPIDAPYFTMVWRDSDSGSPSVDCLVSVHSDPPMPAPRKFRLKLQLSNDRRDVDLTFNELDANDPWPRIVAEGT